MSKNHRHRHPPHEGRDAPPPDADADALRAVFAPRPRSELVWLTREELPGAVAARTASGWRVVQVLPDKRFVGREWESGCDVLFERV